MQMPSNLHWKKLKCNLRYMADTFLYGIHLRPLLSFSLLAYFDTDLGGGGWPRQEKSRCVLDILGFQSHIVELEEVADHLKVN